MKKLINFDIKKKRIVICILVGLIITYPFIIQLAFGLLSIDVEQKRLWIFNMPIKDFTSSWISLWSVVCAIAGIYQVYKKINVLKSQHRELAILQNKQLDTQILNQYFTCISMLNSDSEIVRLNAIGNLYHLANEYNKYVTSVCNNFCDILCSSNKHSIKEKKRVIRYLFEKHSIFHNQEKDLNNCHIDGLSFNKLYINNAQFNNSIIDKCSFQSTTIANSEFIAAKINSTLFRHATIKSTNFKDIHILNDSIFDRNTVFYNLNFTSALLDKTNFNDCAFSECNFSNATIKNTQYSKIKFANCNFDFHHIYQTSFMFTGPKYMKEFKEKLINTNNMHIESNVIMFV